MLIYVKSAKLSLCTPLSGGIAIVIAILLITVLYGGVFAFTPPAAPYPTKRELAGHKSRYENYGEERNLFPALVRIHDCLQKCLQVFPANLKNDSAPWSK